jgi:ABC-type polysaccharide/polyol phosphate transport system ATPase subunit
VPIAARNNDGFIPSKQKRNAYPVISHSARKDEDRIGGIMRIRHIYITNFRDIRELKWAVPNSRTICLIGRGDSTKSTIFEAVRRVFHPQWNLTFDDADFYLCDPAVNGHLF